MIAVVHACAQNEDDMMACKGVGGGGGGCKRNEREAKSDREEVAREGGGRGCKRNEREEKSDRKGVGWVTGE